MLENLAFLAVMALSDLFGCVTHTYFSTLSVAIARRPQSGFCTADSWANNRPEKLQHKYDSYRLVANKQY